MLVTREFSINNTIYSVDQYEVFLKADVKTHII